MPIIIKMNSMKKSKKFLIILYYFLLTCRVLSIAKTGWFFHEITGGETR